MNALVQQECLLLGSEEAIEELENKESARLLVLADSHGEYKLVESIIKEFGPECDAVLFCGDGNEEFAACVENAIYDEDLKAALPPVLATVRGNCDEEAYFIRKEDEENLYKTMDTMDKTGMNTAYYKENARFLRLPTAMFLWYTVTGTA